ncbi:MULTISPECIES: pitrilysin family protein [Xanthomonas]|uniref:Insulinase family protein n=1 Tax=Xanthomonas sontii TaxID=2650745 RepID=A0A6N7QE11_9XANT|nr:MULTISPECIES: pitrilysin family protein [Xanthomonas]MDY4284740.1 pitrilysin family protein [Xanthomonas sp. LF06-19]MRH01036.1 insulinase family protein [Xanthomonas sontii]MRH75529.1 insulinase family protein [Xanthomonas sontii]
MTVSTRPRGALLAVALSVALGALSYAPPSTAARPAAAASVDIAYEQFTLPNGLRVVVHTDRKAPIVAVNLWYHVGAKDEPAGRTGFAHLFEHLMFQGSENHHGEFFEPFKQVGVTDQNGTTNSDRTNYFENVPTTALDMALWMESDRMGHLLGAIDQAALDEQRGVVQNEKRQGENQPYGQAWSRLSRALYPAGHPYHHTVIGSMNDLNAASLADVKQWFRTWYGPNNAVLVLAGDIDVATAKEKVTRYFGDIPAGPSMAQPKVDVAQRSQSTRETMTDKVPQTRIYRVWNVAQTGTEDVDRLQLLAQVLGGATSSRLDRRLVHQDKLVDMVSASVWPSQLGSGFGIIAMVKQGVDPARVEAAIDEELRRLLDKGPDKAELARAKTAFRAGFIRGVERIGGFGGKADVLAECAVYTGDPGCFRTSLATIAETRPRDLTAVGRKWLGKGDYTLLVQPGERVAQAEEPTVQPAPLNPPPVDPKYRTLPSVVDRSAGPPKTTQFPKLTFPTLQRATLKNGTTVILAERHEVPVVQFSYEFQGGYSADQGRKPGTANFTMGMLDDGAGERDALAFADAAEALGASLAAGAALDGSNAYLSALKENLAPSLALYADMLRRPRFAPNEIERVRASWIASIRQEKAQPNGVAMRVLPPLLYGVGHPYAMPFSGIGTEAAIAALQREDLVDFHRDWVRPEHATLIVVGDTTLAEIVPLLDAQFGDWKGEGTAPSVPVPARVARPAKPRVYLIDQPGAVQANLFASELVPPTTDPAAVRFDIANGVIGGDFTSRLNMNLRENKHWSYGARSGAASALGQRPWTASAPVQIDKTAPALQEMYKEISAFASGKAPPTAEEVARIRNIQTLSLPGAYETASAVMGAIGGIVRYGRPDDYVFKRKAEIEAMTPAQVREAASMLDPNTLTWVVVGDLKQIEAPVRALKLGEVTVIDADGVPQGAAAAPAPR